MDHFFLLFAAHHPEPAAASAALLATYDQPERIAELNAAEQALAACLSVPHRVRSTVLADMSSAHPTAPRQLDNLFDTAIQAGALEGEGGVEALLGMAEKELASDLLCADKAMECDDDFDASSDASDFGEDDDDETEEEEMEAKRDRRSRRRRRSRGKAVPAAFEKLGKTKELAETHYYHAHLSPSAPTTTHLVRANEFWAEFAAHCERVATESLSSPSAPSPFVSQYFGLCTDTLTSALMALAVTDLPFEASAPTVEASALQQRTLTATSTPFLLFHSTMASANNNAGAGTGAGAGDGAGDGAGGAAAGTTGASSVMVVQKYVDPEDRTTFVDGERGEKFLDGAAPEFLPGKVYECHVFLTNVSGAPMALELHRQLPQGSMSLDGSPAFDVSRVRVNMFHTHRQQYSFYFPRRGTFDHYPAQVVSKGTLVGSAAPATLNCVPAFTDEDLTSWKYVSARASNAAVLAFLRDANLAPDFQVRLADVAWRLRDKGFCDEVFAVLRERGVWCADVHKYAFFHGVFAVVQAFLRSQAAQRWLRDAVRARCV